MSLLGLTTETAPEEEQHQVASGYRKAKGHGQSVVQTGPERQQLYSSASSPSP